jgi:hypothetical protein
MEMAFGAFIVGDRHTGREYTLTFQQVEKWFNDG